MGATCHSGTSPEMYREPLRVIILNELIESFPNYKFRDIIVEKYRPALLEISCTIITEEGKVFELTFYLSKRRCMYFNMAMSPCSAAYKYSCGFRVYPWVYAH